jgi:transposase
MVYSVGKEKEMRALQIADLTEEQQTELADLYRSTKDVRMRTRAQMVLLAYEHQLSAPAIAAIVREDDETVRRWLKRYLEMGIAGLQDRPKPGAPPKITKEYVERSLEAVRHRPRSLEQSYSMWTLQRLANYLAAQTGIQVSDETIAVCWPFMRSSSVGLSTPLAAPILNTR